MSDEIERWQEAFQKANGKDAPEVTDCGRGWFQVQGEYGRVRRRDFAQRASNLEYRIRQREAQP